MFVDVLKCSRPGTAAVVCCESCLAIPGNIKNKPKGNKNRVGGLQKKVCESV